MAQTAVEWFFDNLKNHEIQAEHFELYQQAKAMEKEQIIQSHYIGGCYFHEARDCRNSEAPCINDAYYYYDEMYNNGL